MTNKWMRQIGRASAAVLAISVLASGCAGNKDEEKPAAAQKDSNQTESGYPIFKEPVTLKVMGSKNSIDGDWRNLKVFQEMEKLTNLKLEFETPISDNYEEKKNLAFAGGQLPDFFFNGNLSDKDVLSYGSQGLLIPLEGLIEKYAPNLKAILDAHPTVKATMTTPDGHIYALPQGTLSNRDHSLYGQRLWPNMALLEQVGVTKLPETTDELYTLLKTVKEKKPESIPLSGANISAIRWPILAAFGHRPNGSSVTFGIEEKNGKVTFAPMEEGYKQYLIYLNKLYKEKLLDNDVFSHTSQEFRAKGNNGKLAVFPDYAPYGVLTITREDVLDKKYPVLPVLTSPANSKKIYPRWPNLTSKSNFAITKNNRYPEATMRWVDYFYSLQGNILLEFGEKLDQAKLDDKTYKFKAGSNVPAGAASDYYRKNLTPQQGPKLLTDQFQSKVEQADIWNYLTEITVKEYGDVASEPYPQLTFTEQDQKRINVLLADIRKYTEQMEAKFIVGGESMDSWDNYVATLKKMNIDELITIHQKAYDKWKAIK